jgi:hypothetical protein
VGALRFHSEDHQLKVRPSRSGSAVQAVLRAVPLGEWAASRALRGALPGTFGGRSWPPQIPSRKLKLGASADCARQDARGSRASGALRLVGFAEAHSQMPPAGPESPADRAGSGSQGSYLPPRIQVGLALDAPRAWRYRPSPLGPGAIHASIRVGMNAGHC